MDCSEAIRILSECKGCRYLEQNDTWSGECTADGKCFEAKMMAIKALELLKGCKENG